MDPDTLTLENKALRFQNEFQAKLLRENEKELRYLRRFKNLVDRCGEVCDKLIDEKVVCYNGPHDGNHPD